MGLDFLLYAGIGIFAMSVLWIIYTLFSVNQETSALSWATEDAPEKSSSPIINFSRPLVHQLTLKYAKKFENKKQRQAITKKLEKAGLTKELNVDEFIGLKIFWGLLFPVIVLILNFALQLGLPGLFIPLLGVFGWMIPDFHANENSKRRQTSIVIDLPFFVDLLALASQAGAEFTSAIERITEKAEDSELAKEFEEFLKDVRLGVPREEALKSMAVRLDIPEVTSFVNVLNDAASTGASIAPALKDQSEFMRVERFVRAEKAGARASQALIVPIVIFILPAVLIMIITPMALQMSGGGG